MEYYLENRDTVLRELLSNVNRRMVGALAITAALTLPVFEAGKAIQRAAYRNKTRIGG